MSEAKLVGVNVSEAQAAFVTKAAEAFIAAGYGKTKADYLRSAIGRASAAQLGEDWPADEVLSGPKDAIALAAEKAGMSRAQFVKYASLVAAGVPAEEAHKKATTPPKTKAPAAPATDAAEAPATE
jgi:hypothetical protein